MCPVCRTPCKINSHDDLPKTNHSLLKLQKQKSHEKQIKYLIDEYKIEYPAWWTKGEIETDVIRAYDPKKLQMLRICEENEIVYVDQRTPATSGSNDSIECMNPKKWYVFNPHSWLVCHWKMTPQTKYLFMFRKFTKC